MARAPTSQRLPKAKQVSAIIDVMSKTELSGYEAWRDWDVLSTRTTIEGVDVDPAGIIVTGDKFVGLAAIYVALQYGSNADDGFETSDTFEGRFEGHFEGATPVIDNVTVDTSPFYE